MSAPIINSIAPSSGPAAGGTQVSIAGSGLSSATDVVFGIASTPGILSTSDSLIVAVSPKGGGLGNVDLSVVTPNGTVTWAGGFDYEVSVDRIYPASGPVTGGLSVDISGSGLLQVYGLLFNDMPAASFTNNDGLITVTTPPATTPGSADISLLDLYGNLVYVKSGGFTYLPAPAPSPAKGSTTNTPPPAPADPGTADPATPKTATPKAATPKAATPDPGTPDPATPKAATPDPGTPKAGTPDPGTPKPTPTPAAPPPPPPSGDYIPGGRMIVPDGKTGLGGTAGTGQGFGVGTLMAGGGSSAAPSNLPYYNDSSLTSQLVQSLIALVQNAASPDALEAQNIILRRMALEGDVIGSRMPPPRNISEIGGYINLLGTLKESSIREQAIAGILGVAGPTQPLGWITNTLALSMVAIPNDRPQVTAQRSFPLTVLVRSDFVAGVQNALKALHSYGGTLPLVSPPVILLPPGGTGSTIPNSILFYLGRTLMIAPSAALIDPAADPIALIPTPTDHALAAQVLGAATFPVPPADLKAVICTPNTQTLVQLSQVSFVPIGAALASAGFYSPSPFPVPANSTVHSWATLTNTTGLVAGETQLRQELSLLYRQDQIASSAFASMLTWTWNGAAFAP